CGFGPGGEATAVVAVCASSAPDIAKRGFVARCSPRGRHSLN
ncbi:MAG: hypothetical protein AVDCRST_MAG11-4030, partial [uncultured Gemmatimonadaceae bacterium]